MAKPVFKITRTEFAIGAALFLIWLALLPVLLDATGIDAACRGKVYGKARVGALATCAAEGGPKGWLFLGYCVSYPLISMAWLRKRFGQMLADTQR